MEKITILVKTKFSIIIILTAANKVVVLLVPNAKINIDLRGDIVLIFY